MEVVLAIGIVSFALLAVFGLFGNALRSKAETLSQQEVLGLTRSLPSGLTNAPVVTNTNGFAEVYGWVKQTNTLPEILGFLDTNGIFRFGRASDPTFLSTASGRRGRLFRIVPALSPNMPMRRADGTFQARPAPSDLPGDVAGLTNHARLPLQISIYEVGAPGLTLSNRIPILTYDATLGRF